MKDMEKLANNNLMAQLELYSDITQNYSNIIHHINEKGLDIHNILRLSKKSDSDEVILTKEQYDKIFDISFILSDKTRFGKLGILAEKSVPDNEIKLKILSTLKQIF